MKSGSEGIKGVERMVAWTLSNEGQYHCRQSTSQVAHGLGSHNRIVWRSKPLFVMVSIALLLPAT